MPQSFTAEQIAKLKSLGINVDDAPVEQAQSPSPVEPQMQSTAIEPQPQPTPPPQPEPIVTEVPPTSPSTNTSNTIPAKDKKINPVVPLLSISGLTILSFGGIVLLKSKDDTSVKSLTNNPPPSRLEDISTDAPSPTQVPKSIQHFLLTSQQFFSQALQLQTSDPSNQQTIELLNQSILAASEAINKFPDDARGYYQRGKIYQSLVDSQPTLLNQTIADLAAAQKLNPNSPDIVHDLASAFAKKGDAQNTINYLAQSVALDPTNAQNFYDLARIQQQAGFIPQALDTYSKLLTLVTDPTQKSQVESERQALEKLLAQTSPAQEEKINQTNPAIINNPPAITLPDNPPTIQAMADSGLIIAAPETGKKIEVKNQTESNSLSGTAALPANQKEISIPNSNLSTTSQVYVTATKGGKNQNLQVLSKSTDSFVVGLDSPINEAIEFKWWIIN